jgi:hypothetical protein
MTSLTPEPKIDKLELIKELQAERERIAEELENYHLKSKDLFIPYEGLLVMTDIELQSLKSKIREGI